MNFRNNILLFVFFLIFSSSFNLFGQIIPEAPRTFPLEQQISLNGRYDFTIFGNTMNSNNNRGCNRAYSLFNYEGNIVEINDGCRNNFISDCSVSTSSSADYNLPNGATLVRAILYWAGDHGFEGIQGTEESNDFNVRFGGQNISAEREYDSEYYAFFVGTNPFTGNQRFQDPRRTFVGIADVTDILRSQGERTYTLSRLGNGNIDCDGQNGFFRGWGVVVVYEDPTIDFNSVTIFDGLESVPDPTESINIQLNNINIINTREAKAAIIAWEGDDSGNLQSDETFRINGSVTGNFLNPVNDVFNGTNSYTGDTDFHNVDIDEFDISNIVNVGDTQINLQVRSEPIEIEPGSFAQDVIYPSVIVLKINSELPDPSLSLDGNVQSDCERDVTIDYLVNNLNSTEVIPPNTRVDVFVNSVSNNNLLFTDFTNEIAIEGSENKTASFNLPERFGNEVDFIIVVDRFNNLREWLEDNNTLTIQDVAIAQNTTLSLPDESFCFGENYNFPSPNSSIGTLNSPLSGVYRDTLTIPNSFGCDSIHVVDLTVFSIPQIESQTLQKCDVNGDGEAIFDLETLRDNFLLDSNISVVNFYENNAAYVGNSPIINLNYTTVNRPGLIIEAISPNDCDTIVNLDLLVTSVNLTNRTVPFCDDDLDGVRDITLLELSESLGSNPDEVTYFTDFDDVESGANPLTTTFSSADFSTVYALLDGCTELITVDIQINLPSPFTLPNDRQFCAFPSLLPNQIDGPNGYDGYLWSSFTNDSIINIQNLNVDESNTYILTAFNSFGCPFSDSIQITIFPIPNISDTLTERCDVNADGFTSFSLDSVALDILQRDPNINDIKFYENLNDFNSGDTISNLTDYISNQKTILIGLNTENSCDTIIDLDLVVNSSLTSTQDIRFCDQDTDGIRTVNLGEISSAIGLDSSDTVVYFPEFDDVEPQTNPILGAFSITDSETIFALVNGCSELITVNITIDRPTEFDLGDDRQLCNFPALVPTTLTPERTDGLPLDYISYLWNTGETTLSIEVDGVGISTYTLTATNNLGCPFTDDISVTIFPVSQTQDRVLEGCDVNLDGLFIFDLDSLANEIMTNDTVVTQVTFYEDADAFTRNDSIQNLQYESPTNLGMLVNLTTDNLCSTLIELDLIVNPVPTSSSTIPLCDSDIDGIINVTADTILNRLALSENDSISFYRNPNDAELRQNQVLNSFSTDTLNPVYVLRDECTELITVNINVLLPTPFDLGPDRDICTPGGTVQLSGAENQIVYLWTFNELDTISNEQNITATEAGLYSHTAVNNLGCPFTDTLRLNAVLPPEIVRIDIPNNRDITIIAENGVSPLVYSVNFGSPQFSNQFFGFEPGVYRAFVEDETGCIDEELFGILSLPDVITPNEDLLNDDLTVLGLDAYPDAVVEIYDRYGRNVGTYSGNQFSWDGTYRNLLLPSDTYYYRIKLPDGRIFKSPVTIKRRK